MPIHAKRLIDDHLLHYNDFPINRLGSKHTSLRFYFMIGAISGAGFQLGIFGIRKLLEVIRPGLFNDPNYWIEIRDQIYSRFDNILAQVTNQILKISNERSDSNKDDNIIKEKKTKKTKDKDAKDLSESIRNTSSQHEKKRPRSTSIGSNASILSQSKSTHSATSASDKRYLEMLVHNVAHTDLVLSLGNINDTETNMGDYFSKNKSQEPDMYQTSDTTDLTLCRPRFSAFSLFSNRILSTLLETASESKSNNEINQESVICFPRHERSDSPRYTLVTPRPSRQIPTPVGFDLSKHVQSRQNLKVDITELSSLRIRGRDSTKIPELNHVMKFHQQNLQEERKHLLRETSHTSQTQEPPHQFSGDNKDYSKDLLNNETPYYLNAIFLPLLATLITRWEESIKQKFSSRHSVKKVVILVSGVGTPRNWTHCISGNSTKGCADIMEIFLNILYPDITVVKIHSESNIFRYDENIIFSKRELAPVINKYRDAHARNLPYPDETNNDSEFPEGSTQNTFNPDWKKTFHVTLSFADGAPARTHAIQAALRTYRPTYFHIWQLKTLWHEKKITSDDVEVHSFEEMETVPAIEIDKASDRVQMVTKEILKFKSQYVEKIMSDENDISKFWLRKTKKPVLAVLAVNDTETGNILLYRGTNMEVSMPTGSLCAERNVIGSALAMNPSLKRDDLIMVAVLAIPLEDIYQQILQLQAKNKEQICDAGNEVPYSTNHRANIKRNLSIGSFASIVEEQNLSDEDEDWIQTIAVPNKKDSIETKCIKMETGELSDSIIKVPPLNIDPMQSSPPNSPARRIRIYTNSDADSDVVSTRDKHNFNEIQNPIELEKMQLCIPVQDYPKHTLKKMGKRGKKRTVVVHSQTDINPLAPCGACNEWLKKIAECNPYFKVLTFTDADCRGVYVNHCQE